MSRRRQAAETFAFLFVLVLVVAAMSLDYVP
jgi:hypothetical protein